MTTEAKWAARVDAWRQSGLTAPAFCKGKDFKAGGLRYWASILRRAEPGPRREVRLARVIRAIPATELDTPIVVEVGGARVGVRRGFDRDTLRGLLDVLAERETQR